MALIRYESVLIEQALAHEYGVEMDRILKAIRGLNDIKSLICDFEKQFADYIGVKYAIAVNSGSDALKMALLASGVGAGDEVIIPNLTYQAVVLAVVYCGAIPVPVDARANDLQMNPDAVKAAMTCRTKAVIGAHMFGQACDVEKIGAFCRDRKIVFIEDVCQAESSKYNNRMLGSFGDMAVFSFSYYKPLSSCGGGGGMIVFNDVKNNEIRHWMEDWRDDGLLLKLGQRFAPMTFMDLVALRVKFSHLKEIIASRQRVKVFYETSLRNLEEFKIFQDAPGVKSVPQNFVLCCDRRDQLADFLTHCGVLSQKAYRPIHLMKSLGETMRAGFPVSEWYFATAIHLPLYSFMNQDKAQMVVNGCRSFLEERR